MRLRSIILVLTLLALISITVSGFYYFFSLTESESLLARRRASLHTVTVKNQLEAFLAGNLKPVRILAGLPEIQRALSHPGPENLERANILLDLVRGALEEDVIYLLDQNGVTIASSNRFAIDSFVGENFSFRPYFQQAVQGLSANYMAMGMTSKKRGAYSSYPVYAPHEDSPVGVVVIKASIELMERDILGSSDEGVTLLTGPFGVIFGANRPDWLFTSLHQLSPQEEEALSESRQFGEGPWTWGGSRLLDHERVEDRKGRRYLVYSRELDSQPGWKVIHLQELSQVREGLFDPLIKTTGLLVFTLCLLAGLTAGYLYRRANTEIQRRTSAENELRHSEERYRALYQRTPAMLHSIDHDGRLVSVSDHWCEALGYQPEEVIGQKLTDFLAEDSRQEAQERNQPLFFRTGWLRDVPYQFVKKDGELMDVLLSAIADYGQEGKIRRSLAVVVDITQRKRAEEQLRLAQEQLSRYSKELERQVAGRTRELMSFLAYTPAVIYLKDHQGRYLLVNSRFEAVWGKGLPEVRGKTDQEVFGPQLAARFRGNEELALNSGGPRQFEELIGQDPEPRTYLSVKFPIQAEDGAVSALWSVSLDISEIKAAQANQRRLSGMILASQEKERTAIARELHDELGQVLTALRIDATWLERRLRGGDQKAAERASSMCQLIDRTITDVRSIATRLRPAVLDDLGLVDALEWYTGDFEKRTGIVCRFSQRQVPLIRGVRAIAAYRVAQEALTNVARHAEAARVEVSLEITDGWLVLTVSDDGRGFERRPFSGQGGWGLAGMQERAALAGGELVITSAPGQGTKVVLRLPLGPSASAPNNGAGGVGASAGAGGPL
ncbi:MAG: PAS domain S-box protein [Desulfarculus sp.]|nr:PAS domain S-box protein [Desulfarculus sp.]